MGNTLGMGTLSPYGLEKRKRGRGMRRRGRFGRPADIVGATFWLRQTQPQEGAWRTVAHMARSDLSKELEGEEKIRCLHCSNKYGSQSNLGRTTVAVMRGFFLQMLH
uniref:Uncharacterized protein n=1 Tax=Oryza sativa subsp. japonica TaxID=39947 RepID=Q6Z9D3_ORYSJ|nr:hypothetical protein [Oryza sativa Japonica Group]